MQRFPWSRQQQGGFGPYGGQFNGPLRHPGTDGAVADFEQRLKDDSFTSIWKMDEASGNAVDTQGVVNAVVNAGVTRSVTSIIPNKPGDDAMGFDASGDSVLAPAVATYDNLFSSDCIFLFSIELLSNADFPRLMGKAPTNLSIGGFIFYRDTASSFPRTLYFLVRFTGADFSIFSNTDALALNTPSLVEVHWVAATPINSRFYVQGVDVTNTGLTTTPGGSVQNANSDNIFIACDGVAKLQATYQYAAIKLGTGNAADALARYNDWNTPG